MFRSLRWSRGNLTLKARPSSALQPLHRLGRLIVGATVTARQLHKQRRSTIAIAHESCPWKTVADQRGRAATATQAPGTNRH